MSSNDYVISSRGPLGTVQQKDTAAAFYSRNKPAKASNAILTSAMKKHNSGNREDDNVMDRPFVVTKFEALLAKCPPPAPVVMLKRMVTPQSNEGAHMSLGKVKVIVRVANSGLIDEKKRTFFQMDQKKRQVTLHESAIVNPSSTKMSSTCESEELQKVPSAVNVTAPKMFVFDGLFTDEDSQIEVANAALIDSLESVVNGQSACVFCFGHAHLGKTYSMLGSDENGKTVGVIPTAIAWLFRSCLEKKEKSNFKFSIRVSAMEIGGQAKEEVRDLLTDIKVKDESKLNNPSSFLSGIKSFFQGVREIPCSTASVAANLLDVALGERASAADFRGDSHFVFTLHLYQHPLPVANRVGSPSLSRGGCSKLHLIDFGSCERTKIANGGITLSNLGHVILAIFNGQKHLPCRDSAVTALLKECLGPVTNHATMLAHISPEPSHYSETLHTTQLASRIHRMRRKKSKPSGGGSGGSGGGSAGSSDETNKKMAYSNHPPTSTDPSSSEQSCDTVIYVGNNNNDDEDTDAEHPPVYLPQLNSGDNRGVMAKVLRGSSLGEKLSPPVTPNRSSTLGCRKSRALAAPVTPMSPGRTMRTRPGSVGSTPTRMLRQHHASLLKTVGSGGSLPRVPKGKMPLTGTVAGYRQQSSSSITGETWIDHPNGDEAWDAPQGTAGFDRYGYMDDHKRSMIQEWVECQARQMQQQQQNRKRMTPVKAPSSLSSDSSSVETPQGGPGVTPEPFEWLKKPGGEGIINAGDRVLTHFRTVESSEESVEEEGDSKIVITTAADIHGCPSENSKGQEKSVPPSPAVSSVTTEDGKDEKGQAISTNGHDSRCQQTPKLLPTSAKSIISASKTATDGGHDGKPVGAFSGGRISKDQDDGGRSEEFEDMHNKSGLSPVAEQSCSDDSSSNCSKRVDVQSLDSNLLHYVSHNKKTSVLEPDHKTATDFDQLVKLHDLYASVSSINAKSQRQLHHNHSGSTVSLGALVNRPTDECNSSSVASDLNSLCSEPAKMPFEYCNGNDINVSLDMFTPGLNAINQESISLSDLGFFLPSSCNNQQQGAHEGAKDRSDSPVLEFIDHRLAEYAKLRDLEKTYSTAVDESPTKVFSGPKPQQTETECSKSREQHVPDGASNPDLNSQVGSIPGVEVKTEKNLESTRRQIQSKTTMNPVVLPRRSPGTGQSSCSSENDHDRTTCLNDVKKSPSMSKPKTATVRNVRSTNKASAPVNETVNSNSSSETAANATTKVPRFSRLFSSASKKISRSPLKLGKSSSNNIEGKTNPQQQQKPANSSKAQRKKTPLSSPLSSQKRLKQQDSSSKSKNVQRTLSPQEASSAMTTDVSLAKASATLPSPYSFPSKPTKATRSSKAETSSNDSGFGNEQGHRVRMRGKGAMTMSGSLSKASRAKHCRSSGYESSLPESIESPTQASSQLSPEETCPTESCLTLSRDIDRMPEMTLKHFHPNEIARMDCRVRSNEVKCLKKVQEHLKEEMKNAKDRLGVHEDKWSYELHVEKSGLQNRTDPAFLDAFKRETQILSKRVDACKSHVALVTCFDVTGSSTLGNSSCCTTECQFAEEMVLHLMEKDREAVKESDIF